MTFLKGEPSCIHHEFLLQTPSYEPMQDEKLKCVEDVAPVQKTPLDAMTFTVNTHQCIVCVAGKMTILVEPGISV